MGKVGSLFAGIGGIDIAFNNAGFSVEWANEIDNKAVDTYRNNFKHKVIHDDIKNLDSSKLTDIDILVGGFPCQAFSVAGYRKGFEDERGSVVFEIFKILKNKKPKVIFLENVKNIVSHNQGETLKFILKTLENIGYYIKYKILNACDYSNIPQNRERIYIVGFLNKKEYDNFIFPHKTKDLKTVSDILDKTVSDEYYYDKYKFYKILKKEIIKSDTFYQWRRHYVRENKNKLCPTLTANMGTGGHNVPLVKDSKGIRKLTPRECARLQGFQDSFKLPNTANCHLYKQIGNSVCIPVVENIAIKIKEAIDGKH